MAGPTEPPPAPGPRARRSRPARSLPRSSLRCGATLFILLLVLVPVGTGEHDGVHLPTAAHQTAAMPAGPVVPMAAMASPGPAFAARPEQSAAATTGGNSSPVREVGTVIASVPTGSGPAQALYDPASGYIYVADQNGNAVTVLNGTQAVSTLGTGTGPFALAYDPKGGEVYAGNTGSNNLSVFSGAAAVGTVTTAFDTSALLFDPATDTLYAASNHGSSVEVIQNKTVIGAVQVGDFPVAFAYDAMNGYAYLANERSGNVSVINGTQLVGTVAVGAFPESLAYDPLNGEVYVANYVSGTVSVLRGTSVAATVTVGANPLAVVVDPPTGDVYVCGSGNNTVTVLRGERVLAWVATGDGPTGGAYDPGTGYLYFTSVNGQTVTVVNGTTPIGVVSVRAGPEGAVPDPRTGNLYVPDFGANNVSVVSTLLWESALSIHPLGDPVQSADVGQPVELDATLSAIGTGNDTAAAAVSPAVGVACGPSVGMNRVSGQILLRLPCVPRAPGRYTVWLNVTDSGRWRVWAYAALQVFSDPAAGGITATVGSNSAAFSADVTEPFRFNEVPSGGTGMYVSYNWTGLPLGECTSTTPSSPSCTVASPANLTVRVAITDSDGVTALSGALAFRVVPLPVAGVPVASRPSVDVGQLLSFTTTASGGSGGYSFSWVGLPERCADGRQAQQTCLATAFGTLRISCTVSDSNGGVSAESTITIVTVFPDPTAAMPTVSQNRIDAGQTVTFRANGAGGSGGYTFSWQGLPDGCTVTGSTAVCVPQQAGTYSVDAVLNDSNGFRVTSAPVTMHVTAAPSSWATATTIATYALGAASAILGGLALYSGLRSRRRRPPPDREVVGLAGAEGTDPSNEPSA